MVETNAKTATNAASKEAGFSWEMANGTAIKVMLNEHPYADAIIQMIPEFEEKMDEALADIEVD